MTRVRPDSFRSCRSRETYFDGTSPTGFWRKPSRRDRRESSWLIIQKLLLWLNFIIKMFDFFVWRYQKEVLFIERKRERLFQRKREREREREIAGLEQEKDVSKNYHGIIWALCFHILIDQGPLIFYEIIEQFIYFVFFFFSFSFQPLMVCD